MVRPEIKKKRREMASKAAQSRKAKKKLEKIVLRKKHKVNRTNLLAELKKHQLQPEQLDLLHSTSSMQTRGLKRFLTEDVTQAGRKVGDIERAEQCLDAAQLVKRRRRKGRRNRDSSTCSSSSIDTDAVSSDSEAGEPAENEKSNGENSFNSGEQSAHIESDSENEDPTKEQQDEWDSAKTGQSADLIETITTQNKKSKRRRRKKPEAKEEQTTEVKREPAVYVPVMRDPEIEKSRLELPIIGEEQNIMENIRYNDIVIVSGETGSGKTTQIPQFLYEAGYALNGKLIGVTEPRRVAAITMSERVAKELNLSQEDVSYQIRFAGNIGMNTKIKFMTDGVLLRECQNDFLLTKYSVLIIDEAHERSVFSDILIGLLSRIVTLRSKRADPLKLIIMSATLRVTDFTDNTFLFKQPPPVINVEARQYPVTVRFAKKTSDNYLQAAYRKVCSVHSKMPKGGILVFVTSQMDVKVLCRKLRNKFPCGKLSAQTNQPRQIKSIQIDSIKSSRDQHKYNDQKAQLTMENLKDDVELLSEGEEEDEDDAGEKLVSRKNPNILDWSDVDSDSESEGVVTTTKTPLFCLGLYAMLPLEKQRLVFKDPPAGTRLCVIATNVAETSITIPNIKYVIDTGMEKTKVYDLNTGVSHFVTTWTSKSSAEQRMGRAGRMGPGYCYRLYSSAVFTNDLPDHTQPRILQKPVEDLLLQMKAMNIDNVVNFPFPTRPSLEALMDAEKKLILLGALDDSRSKKARFVDIKKTEFSSRPTALGKAMAHFGLSARCSKMIVLSPSDLLPHVICLVSALTVREMFLEGTKSIETRKKWGGHGFSKLLGDFMLMIKAICAADSAQINSKFCQDNGLRTKAMLEINKLRRQLINETNKNLNYPMLETDSPLKRPTEAQTKIIRQLLLSAYCDHVARRLPDGEIVEKSTDDPNKMEKRKLRNAYECMEVQGPVYISSESVLKCDHPEFIIYKELYKGDKKTYMRDVAVIEPEWLPNCAFKLCNFSDSNEKTISCPKYDKQLDQIICQRPATYGTLNWPLGCVEVSLSLIDCGPDLFKYFASFLMGGEIIGWFKKYVSKLLSPPSIMTKPWSKLQPRTSKVLQALISNNIKQKKDLSKIWKTDSSFLKREYLMWLPESLHSKINQEWDQMVIGQ